MRLFIRVYANCDGETEARTIASRLKAALSYLTPTEAELPRQYWKQNGAYEFTYHLLPATEQSARSLTERLPSHWTHEGTKNESSAVWNRKHDGVFLTPEVYWAEVQLHEAAT